MCVLEKIALLIPTEKLKAAPLPHCGRFVRLAWL
jgi:hypothetical protein